MKFYIGLKFFLSMIIFFYCSQFCCITSERHESNVKHSLMFLWNKGLVLLRRIDTDTTRILSVVKFTEKCYTKVTCSFLILRHYYIFSSSLLHILHLIFKWLKMYIDITTDNINTYCWFDNYYSFISVECLFN